MPNEQKIDEIIDPAALKQIDELTAKLEEARKNFIGFADAISKANKAIVKGESIKDLETNAARAQALADKARQAAASASLAEERLNQARAKGAADMERKIQKELAAQERRSKAQERITAREISDENKRAAAYAKSAEKLAQNSRPYTVLSNTLETLRRKAQDLAVTFGEDSAQFQKAAKDVVELDNRLKAIDAVLGKYQRNVGNYASGFSQFNNAVNQLTRELPALAVNAQTFFLAISNNLPALFDAFQQASKARKEAVAAATEQAEAAGLSAVANATAAGATEEAANAAGELAKEQALAGAEALKTPGAFKQFLGSLFSLQTALSLGVTLLTIFGAEIVKYIATLFKGEEELDKFKLAQEDVNEALKSTKFTDAVKNVNELAINIKLAKEGFLDKNKVLKQYNESIGETTGKVKTLDEAERELSKNADAFIKITLYKAAAQIALEKAAEQAYQAEVVRRKKLEEFSSISDSRVSTGGAAGFGTGQFNENEYRKESERITKARKDRQNKAAADLQAAADAQNRIAENFQRTAAGIAKNIGADFFGSSFEDKNTGSTTKFDSSEFDAERERVERIKNASKAIVDDERNSLDLRLQALEVFTNNSLDLIRIKYDRDVKEAKGNNDKLAFLNEQLITDREKAISEGVQSEYAINKKAQDDLVKLFNEGESELEKIANERIKVMVSADQEYLAKLSDDVQSALVGTAEQYAKGIINEKQYAQARLDIQNQYTVDAIQAEIDALQEIIDYRAENFLTTADEEKKLAELKRKLAKETADKEIDSLEEVAKREKELRDARKELGKEVAEFGIALVNATFENQKNKIQEEIDLNDVRAKKDIDAINNSVASEKEKADKIAVIEARTAANKAVLEQQQRQIQQRQARFDKAVTIGKIIADTASAVVEALPNVPLSVLVGAIGAAQIATVLATPIPQYKDGTDSSAEGFALTDEVGPELYIPKSGKPYIGSSKGPNIKWLEKGTQVIPHDDLVRMTTAMTLPAQIEGKSWDISGLIEAQKKTGDRLEKAIKGSGRSVITPSAWFGSQQNMSSIEVYIQRNFRK